MKKGTAVAIMLMLALIAAIIGIVNFTRGNIGCCLDFTNAGFCIGMAVSTAKFLQE